MTTIKVSPISDTSLCDEVFALYRKDSSALGFMPRGGFLDGIQKGTLLGAWDTSGTIVGYLLFRVARRRASIAHLCVARESRGKGAARQLVEAIKTLTKHLDCITLRCRRDHASSNLWPIFGFHPRATMKGRGADEAELTVWHFDHGHADLLLDVPVYKPLVAIDANVFFDLTFQNRQHHGTSSALTESWLDDIIELAVTPEVLNDIDRCPNSRDRDLSKARVTGYREIRADGRVVSKLLVDLSARLPKCAEHDRGRSDLKHLAYCIAGNVRYFATRDEYLIENAAELLQEFDLNVLEPIDLIGKLDFIERELEYQPKRVSATQLSEVRLRAEQLDGLLDKFRFASFEKRHVFKALVGELLSAPRDHEVNLVRDYEGNPVLLYCVSVRDEVTTVPLLRVASHSLAPTVLRHTLMTTIRSSANSTQSRVRIAEQHIPPQVQNALGELGFVKIDEEWTKLIMRGVLSLDDATQKIESLGVSAPPERDALTTIVWPAKIESPDTSCYLVPIRAEWAEHLFDTELAATRLPGLSGIRPELHLGVECVYYSGTNMRFSVPGYVLWYVSLGTEKLGSMTVKAVSRLREAVRGTPKDLFKRFSRLGVYNWQQVFEAAHFRLDHELVALRFSHTEVFDKPVSRAQLGELQITSVPQSPRSIPFSTFKSICQLGFNQAV